MGAIAYGHPPQSAPFDETNWTNLGGLDVQPYVKSKTLAERAAWDFVAREGGGLELSVINPAGVFGPALGPDFSGSIDIIRALLDGSNAGGAEDLFRPGRRARRRRSASARDDIAGGERRAVHRRRRRADVDPRDRKSIAARARQRGASCAAVPGARLGGSPRRAAQSRCCATP